MKSKTKFRAYAPIIIGLLGMSAYHILLRFKHPEMMERDVFAGVWFGVCIGLELTGVYFFFKNKNGTVT